VTRAGVGIPNAPVGAVVAFADQVKTNGLTVRGMCVRLRGFVNVGHAEAGVDRLSSALRVGRVIDAGNGIGHLAVGQASREGQKKQ